MLMFLLTSLMASFFDTTAGQIGVCYGMVGNNLPRPSEVVAMYKQYNIQRMRIYGPNSDALNALRGSNIELILDVPNSDLGGIASSQTEANTWSKTTSRTTTVSDSSGAGSVLIQAMQNIDRAVSEAGLRIQITTTTYMGAFTDTYPPSSGRFRDEYRNFLQPAIRFLVNKRSPLLVNIYTFFGYKDSRDISLEFALFKPNPGFKDPQTQHSYNNLFDANLDSVYAALDKLGGGSLDIVVSESGWPTSGGDRGTSVENARTYVNNLIQHVKNGSPRRPGKAIETYIFAMFNENDKTPEYEKYWGLFLPNKQPQYEVNLN
ncbi:unnamed protein product [Eruca vesicaria subsp. sativa]|uniref:glucan endo-1,3-beta-D-glucosidase n=1 Tax=Eruca vesicaria subsp. sativa TaxID=29727 RepID=A0ABC8JTK3_ERUVS|nr:unnamed protein product [Eruca vesicaria subsp. sativa]